MRVTGWDTATLRRQPARVVRAHFARIFAGLIWSPELAQAATGPPPPRTAFGSLADYAEARRGKAATVEAIAAMRSLLWPEGD